MPTLFCCRDPRNPAAPLRAHESTHSDDITALHFSKSQNNLLLSASSDGLVCTSNAVEDDEDEAGLHVGNVGSSVAQAGWMSEAGGSTSVWAAISRDLEGKGGKYLERCQISQPKQKKGFTPISPGHAEWAYDQEAAKRLYDESLKLVGLS